LRPWYSRRPPPSPHSSPSLRHRSLRPGA
jgi:hypothetical protein